MRLASNIGLEGFWSLHDSGISKTHTRLGGVSERLLILVFSEQLEAKSWQLLREDDI